MLAKRRLLAQSIRDRSAVSLSQQRTRELSQAIAKEREKKQHSDRTEAELRAQLDRERAARESAEKNSAQTAALLAQESDARLRAEAKLQAALDKAQPAQRAAKGPPESPKAANPQTALEPSKPSAKGGPTPNGAEQMPDFRP